MKINQSIRHLVLRSAGLGAAVAFALLLSLPSQAAEKPKSALASATKGQTLYTQFSLYQEDNLHRTTNYRKGVLVPANTEVTFVKATRNEIIVQLPGGNNLTLENVQGFSGENLDGIFARTFSTQKLDLSKFTEPERKSIALGEVKPGMTKAAVIVAIGYPPKHRTPSLEGDAWRYWLNRFATFVVHFENGKVSSVEK